MMERSDSLIEDYYGLWPIQFTFVEDFHVKQVMPSRSDDYYMYLDLELRHQDPEDYRRLVLSFQGVRNLRLTPPAQMVLQMIYLEITSVRANGWEGVNYAVREREDDTLSFLCEKFTAKIQDD